MDGVEQDVRCLVLHVYIFTKKFCNFFFNYFRLSSESAGSRWNYCSNRCAAAATAAAVTAKMADTLKVEALYDNESECTAQCTTRYMRIRK